ncbi:MAG: hypothetical protein WCC63_06330 [Candidatus Bathyarchaeia archaeon]
MCKVKLRKCKIQVQSKVLQSEEVSIMPSLRLLLVSLLAFEALFASCQLTPRGYCIPSGVSLFPSEGSALTEIMLRAFVPLGSTSFVYWDNAVPVATYVPYDNQVDGFILNFNPPNEHLYSDLGNHTVTVEAHYWDNGE